MRQFSSAFFNDTNWDICSSSVIADTTQDLVSLSANLAEPPGLGFYVIVETSKGVKKKRVARAELDAGLVGYKSSFWTMVEKRFNEGFPPEGVDGMTFADLLHHLHPLFHQNESTVDPSIHGTFSAQKLMALWKELLKEYDTVMVNFTKSGNHDSSFTRAAMSALKNDGDNNRESVSLDSLNDDDLDDGDDDEFGVESGGWCGFTNSLPVIYLRMWLNQKPDFT